MNTTTTPRTALLVGSTDTDTLLRHILNKDGWIRKVNRAAAKPEPRVKLAQLVISEVGQRPGPTIPDNRNWWQRMRDRWFREKGKGLIWHSKTRDVYSEPFEVPCHVHRDPNHPAWDLLWLLPSVAGSIALFHFAPGLLGCLAGLIAGVLFGLAYLTGRG